MTIHGKTLMSQCEKQDKQNCFYKKLEMKHFLCLNLNLEKHIE